MWWPDDWYASLFPPLPPCLHPSGRTLMFPLLSLATHLSTQAFVPRSDSRQPFPQHTQQEVSIRVETWCYCVPKTIQQCLVQVIKPSPPYYLRWVPTWNFRCFLLWVDMKSLSDWLRQIKQLHYFTSFKVCWVCSLVIRPWARGRGHWSDDSYCFLHSAFKTEQLLQRVLATKVQKGTDRLFPTCIG